MWKGILAQDNQLQNPVLQIVAVSPKWSHIGDQQVPHFKSYEITSLQAASPHGLKYYFLKAQNRTYTRGEFYTLWKGISFVQFWWHLIFSPPLRISPEIFVTEDISIKSAAHFSVVPYLIRTSTLKRRNNSMKLSFSYIESIVILNNLKFSISSSNGHAKGQNKFQSLLCGLFL